MVLQTLGTNSRLANNTERIKYAEHVKTFQQYGRGVKAGYEVP